MHATTKTLIGGGAYCVRADRAGEHDCDRFVLAGDSSPISGQDLRGFVARTSFELGKF